MLKGLGKLCDVLHSRCGKELEVPQPVLSTHQQDVESINDCPMANGGSAAIAMRVFTWVKGITLNQHGSNLELLHDVGRAVGVATNALQGFDHPAFHRYHSWDGQQFKDIKSFFSSIEDLETKKRVEMTYDKFVNEVIPDSDQFPKSVLLGDCNDANIIVSEQGGKTRVTGLIDFGDSCYSWTVNDIAIAIAYGIITTHGLEHPILTFAAIVSGYCLQRKLLPVEVKHLLTLVSVRLAASTSMGAYSISQDPNNEYLKLHAQPARDGLLHMSMLDSAKIRALVHIVNARCTDVPFSTEVLYDLIRIANENSSTSLRQYFKEPIAVTGEKRILESQDILPTLTFVTGNARKLDEVKSILGDSLKNYVLVSQKLDLPELQGSPEEVSAQKCKLAAQKINGAVMVEDTSLCYNALGGLPGVYIKWFLEGIGLEGLSNILEAYSDKTAYAQCIFSLFKNDGTSSEPLIFVGRCHGKIVPPRGSTKFGWDPVFQPENSEKTFAEMTSEEKNSISHRFKALDSLRDHLMKEHAKGESGPKLL